VDAGTGPKAKSDYLEACPDLPELRPADLVIRHSVYTYGRPEALARFVLFDERTSCPPDDMPGHLLTFYARRICVPMRPATFDELFARLRVEGFARMRTRPRQPQPHSAGRLLDLRWGAKRCSVGDVLGMIEIEPEQRVAFFRASDAVSAATRATLGLDGRDAGTPPKPQGKRVVAPPSEPRRR
jgi:hypothetical protein